VHISVYKLRILGEDHYIFGVVYYVIHKVNWSGRFRILCLLIIQILIFVREKLILKVKPYHYQYQHLHYREAASTIRFISLMQQYPINIYS